MFFKHKIIYNYLLTQPFDKNIIRSMKIEKATQLKRDRIYYEVWQKTKNEIPMSELAKIFNISLASLYRILKAGKKNENKTTN